MLARQRPTGTLVLDIRHLWVRFVLLLLLAAAVASVSIARDATSPASQGGDQVTGAGSQPWDSAGRLVQRYVGLGNDGRDDTPCGPVECP